MAKAESQNGKSLAPKKAFKAPHTLVILVCFILLSVLLTWIVPAGSFTREKNEAGIEVIDPQSFEYIESSPVSPLRIPNFIMDGFTKSATLFFLLLMTGGAFHIIVSSGALHSVIAKIAKKFASRQIMFIPILSTIFALIGTTQGINTFIGFAPITVLIARAMGFDSIVGAAIILLGGAVGFSTGTLNPSTTIVAQEICGLPLYSGIEYRWVCFAIYLVVTNVFLIRYAKKIKANPQLSPMYDLDKIDTELDGSDLESFGDMTLRKWLVLLSLVGTLVVIVYGGVSLDWGLSQNAAAFIWLGIVAGVVAGFTPSKIASTFVEGAKRMVGAAMIIGIARAVSSVLTAGLVLDTVVNGMGMALMALPSALVGIFMFWANILINMFITSGSGQAAVVMPIFAPLSDMLGFSRQTAILAFNFGDGFCNYILPTSTALMGILGATNIPYDRWMRFMWKLFLIWVAVGSILCFVAQFINY